MTTQLVITRGNVASGKSTYATQWVEEFPLDRMRVERDMIREQMYDEFVLDYEREKTVTVVQRAMVEAGLRAGKSVIVSDTNLRSSNVRDWMKVAKKFNAEFVAVDMEVPLEECIRRNKARGDAGGRFVPEDVIRNFHDRYMRKGKFPPLPESISQSKPTLEVEPYVDDPTLPEIALVDLDGTLALNNGHRGFYEWHKVGADEPIESVIRVVSALRDSGVPLVFMSGRDAVCRPETTEWLERHGFVVDALHMRPAGSMEPDSKVKLDLFNEHIRGKYRVVAAFDDRLSIARLWHSLGLPLFRVGDPDADF